MATARVSVIVPPDLADGYRLAGIEVREANTAADTARLLEEILAEAEPPTVIAVHPAHLDALEEHRRRRLDQLDNVLIVPLPDPQAAGPPALPGRDSLRDLLAHAVGYEFTFKTQGGNR
jgi:vacuolar-type H+-ATPase subunit F/Vma7